jgi:hypothetical protein
VRLWSLHPVYLDAKGLVALWREGLLARAVLKGQTQGYRHHPQLERFRRCAKPLLAIDAYLWAVHEESQKRGYRFDAGKLGRKPGRSKMWVTDGQLRYEWAHLAAKLKKRAPAHYRKIRSVEPLRPHPLFRVRAGEIAGWERMAGR